MMAFNTLKLVGWVGGVGVGGVAALLTSQNSHPLITSKIKKLNSVSRD